MSKKLIYALKDKGAQVIAIDWRYNSEIILDGKSGLIYRNKDTNALIEKLLWCYENYTLLLSMKKNCIKEAERYLPQKVINILIEKI